MHLINLEFGDCGGDGHDKSRTIAINSNVDRPTLAKMIRSKEVRDIFDVNDECSDYDDSALSVTCTNKLHEIGIVEEDLDTDRLNVCHDDYVNLLLDVVKHCYPEFEYEVTRIPTIDIGGYGLFT